MSEYQVKMASMFLSFGVTPIPLEKNRKNPIEFSWAETKFTSQEQLDKAFSGDVNVGIILGTPSNGFVDVDLDCIEAVRLANTFLPPTGLTWGRMSKPMSHWGYRVTGGEVRRSAYPDPLYKSNSEDDEDKSMIVEIRGDGHQTMVPPSVHPSGEVVTFYSTEQPSTVDLEVLRVSTGILAAAAFFAKYWDSFGPRHFLAMNLAGALARSGWTEEATDQFITSIATTANDEEIEDRRRTVRDTYLKFSDDSPTGGWPTLRDTLGEEVIVKIRKWLNIQDNVKFPMNDMGNAQRFLGLHSEDVRYCPEMGEWLVWDSRRWVIDRPGNLIGSKALTVQREIMKEAVAENDPDRSQELAKWALISGSRDKITAIPAVAKDINTCWITTSELDRNDYKINVTNGILDLRTGGLERPHNRGEYLTKLAGVSYNPSAGAPRFQFFLETIFNGNQGLIDFIQKLAGYSLTGSTDEQIFPILWGSGANGKSTLLEIMRVMMGEYCQVASSNTFLQQNSDRIRTDLARMNGARLITSSEIAENRKLDTAMVKSITGGDKIQARFLYKSEFEYTPGYKVWMATNYKPVIQGDDDAMFRRLVLIPFSVTIPTDQQDPKLKQKIIDSELPGVFAWAVAGCMKWQREGLGKPPEIVTATAHYKEDSDTVGNFIKDSCLTGKEHSCSGKALYATFQIWCRNSGEKYIPLSQFKNKMTTLGYVESKNGSNWEGIAPIQVPTVDSVTNEANNFDHGHDDPFRM